MQLLPSDAIENVLLFVGEPSQVAKCGQVCRSFRQVAIVAHLWRGLAHLKYGKSLSEESGPLYDDDWKELMVDDNKKGAMPTLPTPQVCMYAYNTLEYFFCCIVQCVKWHRDSDEIRVYIDVRGENDLRHPMGSSLALITTTDNHAQRPMQRGPQDNLMFPLAQTSTGSITTVTVRPTQFIADQEPTLWHYKGSLSFPTESMRQAGIYSFCYANPQQQYRPDYRPINLFEIPSEGGLEQAFKVGRGKYSSHVSPFLVDTIHEERKRWTETVPDEVMRRDETAYSGRWYI